VRKAEGQLRLDVHTAAQNARKQLLRVQQLLPVAEEAAAQAIAATQVAASALRANPTLKSAATTAPAMQRDAVRHALRNLASVGDSSTYAMEGRVEELRHCEEHLSSSIYALEQLVPNFQRAGEHGILTPGTMSSTHGNSDTISTLSLSSDHDQTRQSLAEALHLAHEQIFNAREVCRYGIQQVRMVRADLTTSRGKVQQAQSRMAADRLSRSRSARASRTLALGFSPRMGVHALPNAGPSDAHPATGVVPRWPQPAPAKQERQGFRHM